MTPRRVRVGPCDCVICRVRRALLADIVRKIDREILGDDTPEGGNA